MIAKLCRLGLAAWGVLALSSCMYAEGNSQTGQWRIAALGTDINKHDINERGWKADVVNNSVATEKVTGGVITKAKLSLMGQGVSTVGKLGNTALNSTLK